MTPEVGEWGEEKYQLVRCYAQIFARSMKHDWESRVYIDLFAGAGRAILADSRRIVQSSPLLALGIDDPFDRYIFCEIDDDKLLALRKRVQKDYPSRNVRFVPGDSNSESDQRSQARTTAFDNASGPHVLFRRPVQYWELEVSDDRTPGRRKSKDRLLDSDPVRDGRATELATRQLALQRISRKLGLAPEMVWATTIASICQFLRR